MSASRRSTTGCTTCKTKRKKCDESKPKCQRCVNAGSECSYDFVEYPDHQSHRKKRTKPAPRAASEVLAKGPRNNSVDLLGVDTASSSMASTSGTSIGFVHPILSGTWTNDTYSNPDLTTPWATTDQLSLSTALVPSYQASPLYPMSSPHTSPDLDQQLPNGLPAVCDMITVAPAQAPRGLTWIDYDANDEDESESSDVEGVQVVLCTVPNLDRNVRENTLPFVLHCYSQWAISRLFEPLTVANSVKTQVIQQFSSEHTRKRTILIANVMITFAKHLTIDNARMSILDHLVVEARKSGSQFLASPVSTPALDRQSAMRTLDNIFEILTLQTHTQPTAACVRTLDYAAPVFRRACSEPPGVPVNLPNILLEPSLNLRHFASVDVMQSVTTGRPTYFQYEVPFSLELCDRMYQLQDNQGSQWLYGLPDQFIMLIGWINSLADKPGGNDYSELVTWIEKELPHIKVATSESGDPLLRIGRMVVLECWRYAVFIYLYMHLCKADASDPRVVRSVKGFMRLVRGVKPGRIPDAFLVCPGIVAGVAALEERDRVTLCQRILNVRECSEVGTAVNEYSLSAPFLRRT
ncbi:hypothetical protein OPQ81_008205 [Rhizoctonia solani]|nr:hypothetical protein OPQ81_008205 [Rhizoctonia solani]